MKNSVVVLSVCLAAMSANGLAASSVNTVVDLPCTGETDCQAKWQRAEQWVRSNSEWPLQTVSDTVIETEKQRFRNYSSPYYLVIKEARGDQTVIRFEAGCLPSVQCSPDIGSVQKAFTGFVGGATE
ncbi:MAG TPA: hypothetical protein VIR60_09725 [Gammaproteobacteria bacterium]